MSIVALQSGRFLLCYSSASWSWPVPLFLENVGAGMVSRGAGFGRNFLERCSAIAQSRCCLLVVAVPLASLTFWAAVFPDGSWPPRMVSMSFGVSSVASVHGSISFGHMGICISWMPSSRVAAIHRLSRQYGRPCSAALRLLANTLHPAARGGSWF